MMSFNLQVPVYLHREPIDFRKQINGISVIVQEEMTLNVFDESFFVFINRQRNRVKVLYWQRNGFCLWMKRLEKDKFKWPKHLVDGTVQVSAQELQWLLEGFDIWHKPPHQPLHFTSV